MAGGSGTRFWPASRAACPKQLLSLVGRQTMIQSTVSRLGDAVPPQRVLIVTNQRQAEQIAAQLPQLPPTAILGEPCKRDTAPCIGLAALYVSRDDDDATMVVMPADHVISPEAKFQEAIRYAASLLEENPRRLITFGIRPSYPAESFGYIERGEPVTASGGEPPTFRVKQFREKPSAETARQYVESGDFYWNSGIFVWKASTILDELRDRQPDMHAHLAKIAAAFGTSSFESVFAEHFAAIEGVSIDYAVMEHATDVLTVEAPFDWDDVGSWQAIARLHGTDDDGNTISGRHLGLDTTGSIVRGDDDHLIVTMGLKDMIVVHTPDATLVANKHDEESIRKIVKLIEEKGWKEFL